MRFAAAPFAEANSELIEPIRARLPDTPSSMPKYQVLRDAIVDTICSGDWRPGMRLPTETELVKALPYSLGTVQKAYGELVKGGLVVRTRGRGSFVAPLQRQMTEPWHCRFLADDGEVLPIYPRLLGHEVAAKDPRWADLFGPKVKVVRIDRAIAINKEFDVLSRFFAPEAIVRPLLTLPRREIESANFKAILLRELGMPVTRIVQTIGTADRETWRRLGIESRPHLRLEATAYSAAGTAAYFQEIYIPENRRKLLFDSQL